MKRRSVSVLLFSNGAVDDGGKSDELLDKPRGESFFVVQVFLSPLGHICGQIFKKIREGRRWKLSVVLALFF